MSSPNDFVIKERSLPEPSSYRRGVARYPWDKLDKVGLAFFVHDRTVSQMCAAAANSRPAQVKGWKFSCSKGENEGVKGTWVTRTK